MLDKLLKNRNSILFIELAGLLHDIGKLSKAFLEYRQEWQSRPNGYYEDPHDHNYLDREVFKDLIPLAFTNKEIKDIGGFDFGEPDFSIEKAVHFHVDPPDGSLITKMLKTADGVDAAIDRNNPLWSAEQKTGNIFRSNVFGYETGRIVTLEQQEDARKELYKCLGDRLPQYLENFNCDDRTKMLDDIKAAFEHGLSDTTRPQNDTTLWEHSYAVASILKGIAVHKLLCRESLDKPEKVRFCILGIGWDGMRFLSYGQKIGDIIGRKNIIEDIKESLKLLIEYEYPVGNEIYSDDDGICFIVPAKLERYESIWNEIEQKIYSIAADISCGELQPSFYIEPETKYITRIVNVINKLRKFTTSPFNSGNQFDIFRQSISDHWPVHVSKTICPICRLRPVEKEDEKKKACKICKKRRTQEDNQDKNKGTLFIDEIVDKNRRAALIVARFGLDNWLNGKMVRSMFVTEAKGIEKEIKNLGKVKSFEGKEDHLIKYFKDRGKDYKFSRVKGDIDSIYNNEDNVREQHTAFLYHRRNTLKPDDNKLEGIRDNWTKLRNSSCEEGWDSDKMDILLYNVLCAKTPTPSTVLDVWDTTLEFIKDMQNVLLKNLFTESTRLTLKVQPINGDNIYDWGKGTLEAKIDETGVAIELLYRDNEEVEIVGEKYSESLSMVKWKGKTIRITDKDSHLFNSTYEITTDCCYPGDNYYPYRTITTSPNLFMAIVPADRAVEITDLIYQKYIEQFGKVIGRLPFSIGNIFFGHKMPMFVVLDAGKKMVANFDKLAKETENFTLQNDSEKVSSHSKFKLKCTIGEQDKTLTWLLPHKLGNCDVDYHHPYFILSTDGNDLDSMETAPERTTFFKTVAGDVVHFSQVKAGDKISAYPNYYDFEFLDSNARRHDIALDDQYRRKSNVADFNSKPFLLDELGQKMMCLWDVYLKGKGLKGITDTKLRNLQSLWLTKYQEWVEPCKENKDKWKDFVAASIKEKFKLHRDSEQYKLLMETIDNGLFFDTLELYLGILKERIETK